MIFYSRSLGFFFLKLCAHIKIMVMSIGHFLPVNKHKQMTETQRDSLYFDMFISQVSDNIRISKRPAVESSQS